MLNKEKERARLDKLRKSLEKAESYLERGRSYEYEYQSELYETKKAINGEFIEEKEKKEKFRKGLYRRLAFALAGVFGIMALASGLLGAINLIVSINQGIVNALGALAWVLVTVGLTFASVIAMAAKDAM